MQARREAEAVALARLDHPLRALEQIFAAQRLWLEQDAPAGQGEALGQPQHLAQVTVIGHHELPPDLAREKATDGIRPDPFGFVHARARELERDIPLNGAVELRRRR